MSTKSSNKPQRVHPDFANSIRGIMQERLAKGLSKPLPSEISMAEGTRLILKTDGWKKVMEELKSKPKKYE